MLDSPGPEDWEERGLYVEELRLETETAVRVPPRFFVRAEGGLLQFPEVAGADMETRLDAFLLAMRAHTLSGLRLLWLQSLGNHLQVAQLIAVCCVRYLVTASTLDVDGRDFDALLAHVVVLPLLCRGGAGAGGRGPARSAGVGGADGAPWLAMPTLNLAAAFLTTIDLANQLALLLGLVPGVEGVLPWAQFDGVVLHLMHQLAWNNVPPQSMLQRHAPHLWPQFDHLRRILLPDIDPRQFHTPGMPRLEPSEPAAALAAEHLARMLI